jgi:hypothetical protein
MDQFPQELVDQICSYLSSEDLRNVYYVSTKFRKAAEEHAGSYRTRVMIMTKECKDPDIDYYSGFRLRYLNLVEFHTTFPDLERNEELEHWETECRESTDELHQKDKIFTEQIQDLFATLKMIEERAGKRNHGKYKLIIFNPTQRRVDQCQHRDHDLWHTHLLEPETLPILMSVKSLEISTHTSEAKLDYRILIDFITRCPNLESVKWRIGSYEWVPRHDEYPASQFLWEYGGPRRDTRHYFAKAITPTNIPKSLQRFELDFFCYGGPEDTESVDHWKAMPNLVSPALKDPFSTSLRILSYHLQELTLRVQADETLFWPEEDSLTPIWPHLQKVNIKFHMVSPSGTWYFEGPRGEGRDLKGYEIDESSYPPLEMTEEDEDAEFAIQEGTRSFQSIYCFMFRMSPNNDILGPFLTSFAKAAANMPDLRRAVLWSPLRWDVYYEEDDFEYFQPPYKFYSEGVSWGLVYYMPGESESFQTYPGEVQSDARQIWWSVGEWRPNPEIHSLFQQIGRQKHGEALKEYWNDDEYSQRYVPRYYFR